MSHVPPPEENPYQSPSVASTVFQPTADAYTHYYKVLTDFCSQIFALGAVWIVFGTVAVVVGVFSSGLANGRVDDLNPISEIVIVSGLVWITLGVLVCWKHIWALYMGLVLSYLSIVSSVFQLQICAVVILAFVILQAHRVLGWAKELRRAGIPLTTRPEDLQMTT